MIAVVAAVYDRRKTTVVAAVYDRRKIAGEMARPTRQKPSPTVTDRRYNYDLPLARRLHPSTLSTRQ